ncbi:hypothetical protein [Floridanema evergladense]|uniref:Uncharacterized protein n=1 Tax=Floridaenema evergladense BLCC-F167 TaxID=3153639 RepID=A0ABV4WEH6_9CYAN
MPLPQNFSEWEHLQNQVRRLHNERVREFFADVDQDDDISSPRGSLKQACLLKDKDSAIITAVRMMFFEFSVGNARSLQAPIYGMPVDQFQEEFEVSYRPMVRLYFSQDLAAVPNDLPPIRQEISFRLMNETSETISNGDLSLLANKIRTKFWTYDFNKGKIKTTYTDPSKGYRLSINAISESEGLNVIQDVLSIQGHTIEDKFLNVKDKPRLSSDNSPGTKTILGKPRKGRRWRPTGTVRFRFANISICGLAKDPILVDKTGTFPQAIISN